MKPVCFEVLIAYRGGLTSKLACMIVISLSALLCAVPAQAQGFPSLAINPDSVVADDNPNDVPLAPGEPCSSRSDFKFNPALPTGFLTYDYHVAPLATRLGFDLLDTSDAGVSLSSREEGGRRARV